MHIDESKRLDKRNIEKNIKNGVLPQKEYEIYLSKLPDVSNKIFNPEEPIADSKDFESRKEDETQSKKRGEKKKAKGKGK
jgi:hypothetical protein